MKLIKEHINELNQLCESNYVSALYIFGSYATNTFKENSDIDFLVEFSGVEPLNYFDNYLDFKINLEKLFSKNIDLVEIQTIKNPILQKAIDRDKIMLYGRESSKVAV